MKQIRTLFSNDVRHLAKTFSSNSFCWKPETADLVFPTQSWFMREGVSKRPRTGAPPGSSSSNVLVSTMPQDSEISDGVQPGWKQRAESKRVGARVLRGQFTLIRSILQLCAYCTVDIPYFPPGVQELPTAPGLVLLT